MKSAFQNQSEYREIFESHYGMLCNFARRYFKDQARCEDLVQSVFLRLWENRETTEITGSLTSYLMTATRNAALDKIRSDKRKQQLLEEQGVAIHEDPADTEATFRQHLFRQKLYEAIQALKPKTREIFTMHKIEGLTYQEISEHLEIPKRTVEYNIYTALAQLKDMLKEDYEQYRHD